MNFVLRRFVVSPEGFISSKAGWEQNLYSPWDHEHANDPDGHLIVVGKIVGRVIDLVSVGSFLLCLLVSRQVSSNGVHV